MKEAAIIRLLPLVSWWVERTVRASARDAVPVASLKLDRLPRYFSAARLESSRILTSERMPMPPGSEFGMRLLSRFKYAPNLNPAGITYKNTYFLLPELVADESIHFHEMVHVIQWECLGVEPFLLAYTLGFLEKGYLDCPLEEMAYRHEFRFETSPQPYDVEAAVSEEIDRVIKPSIARWL